jgi:hypothetical protein
LLKSLCHFAAVVIDVNPTRNECSSLPFALMGSPASVKPPRFND